MVVRVVSQRVRVVLWIVVAVQVVLAAGFAFEVDAALDLWPFGERSQLTAVFVGSIFAAAAASTAWCLLTDSMRGLAGIALDYLVILLPFAAYSLFLAARDGESRTHLVAFGLAALAGAAVGLVLLRAALRAPWRDTRPTPPLVRYSFAAFSVALVIVASLLLARMKVLPWPVTDELSTVIGVMFLGAAAYFVYGLLEPCWENAGGQLAGFLAYDLVLILPFLDRLPSVDDEFRVNLIVYTVVVVYSGLLAIWFLFLNPGTRGATGRPEPGR
jgi:hypothetical protein